LFDFIHPVNQRRTLAGLEPASYVPLWGRPVLQQIVRSPQQQFQICAAVEPWLNVVCDRWHRHPAVRFGNQTDRGCWKSECAPLMIQQKGCIPEKLLCCRDAHEFISYSEWNFEADIATYTSSDAHKEIVRHARGLKGSKAVVKLYELVQ
jgi:hypothetical protein